MQRTVVILLETMYPMGGDDMSDQAEKNKCRETERRRGASWRERMGPLLDVPSDLLCGGCYLEMRGQGELHLRGCRRIAEYGEEQIVLQLCHGFVRVRGHRLVCLSYHAGGALIRGWICGIDFSETEEKT